MCPVLDAADWDLKKHVWEQRAFYRTKHFLFCHIPIGIGGAIKKGFERSKRNGYTISPPYMMLDVETGLFTAEMLIAIEEIPKNDPDVVVWEPTTLYSKLYHGPFKNLGREVKLLNDFVEKNESKQPEKLYSWVSNCPKCWKTQGGPTTVLFARI
jgi:hypothetical protein